MTDGTDGGRSPIDSVGGVSAVGYALVARPGLAVRSTHRVAAVGRVTVGRVSERARTALSADRVDEAVAEVGATARTTREAPAAVAASFLYVVGDRLAKAAALSAVPAALGRPAALPATVLAVPLPSGLGGVEATLGVVPGALLAIDPAAVLVVFYRVVSGGTVVPFGGAVVAVRTLLGGPRPTPRHAPTTAADGDLRQEVSPRHRREFRFSLSTAGRPSSIILSAISTAAASCSRVRFS